MYNNIYPIILGNNGSNLFGSENDAILIYNLFYSFYLEDNIWKKPILYINNNVLIDNVLKTIKKINRNNLILIYFSGHSCKNGRLQFHDKYYSNDCILTKINSLKKKYIYFIIDSCYSKKFIHNINYKNILKLNYIVSCSDIQKSKEIIIDNNDIVISKILNTKDSKIVMGIFTFYFYKLLKKKKIYNIEEWDKNILNNYIWKIIEKKYNQTLYYNK